MDDAIRHFIEECNQFQARAVQPTYSAIAITIMMVGYSSHVRQLIFWLLHVFIFDIVCRRVFESDMSIISVPIKRQYIQITLARGKLSLQPTLYDDRER